MEIDSDEILNDDEIQSDDSDADETALEIQVAQLENKIAENKFAYQPYLDLIKILKSLLDLDRLRNARKRMADQFPLSPDLWIDWLQDEINIATTSEEKQKIVDLFETAVKDYLSVEIWLMYINFVIRFQHEQNCSDVTFVRKIFEEALAAAGLHVTKGSVLWDTYIEYEKEVLQTLKNKPQEYENQLKLIGNVYKRQLSCPYLGMDETFKKFETWLTEVNNICSVPVIDVKLVENIYKKAKEKLDKIKAFEEALLSNSESNLHIYKEYVEHEKSKDGSPVRVQCLYERIVCDNCLKEELWLEYVEYVDTVLNNSDVVLNICKRALRNCPWCCHLYQAYIKYLEKYEQPQNVITKVVEEAFASGLQVGSDFRDVWMSYLEYLRRKADSPNLSKEGEEKQLEELRTAFATALDFITQLEDADPRCTIAQFWARIEANYCRNMEKARELWNHILADDRNRISEMWLEYIHLERTFGDSKHLRKLFPRALQATKDWPELIGNDWLNYERDEGTLESYENCVNKIKLRMKQVQEQREREASTAELEKPDYQRKKPKKVPLPKQTQQNYVNSSSENKVQKVTGYKRKQKDLDVENCATKKSKQDQKKEEEGKEPQKEQGTKELVQQLLEENKKSHGETVVHDSSKDYRTVFVSNLDFSTEEDSVREALSSCGKITDLRLVRDYKGRSKGYCYVEFAKEKDAESALKKDREPINGRPMFVSKCDPDKETRSSGFKFSSSMEKNKLFVRGLPFSVTVEDLRTLFSEFGDLKDVRLVTYRNGHSKGLAYVDFEDELSAAQAILKVDGTTIQGKEISVAISNPPGRKSTSSLQSKPVLSLGGGAKELGPRGRGRTQISFLPRAVHLNKQSNAADSLANLSIASPSPAETQKKLT